MKQHKIKKNMSAAIGLALITLTTGSVHAEVLYNISSFNNDDSSNTATQWVAGITTITSIAGVTGTDDAGLVAFQTLQANPITAARTSNPRFSNQDSSSIDGTVISDDDATKYFGFGIDADLGNTINITSLSFDAARATGGTEVRGFDINYSTDGGGSWLDLSAQNVTNNRSAGLQNFDLTIALSGITQIDFQIFSTVGAVEYTNFAINGSVIPEPGTFALIAGSLALGAVMVRRRRR